MKKIQSIQALRAIAAMLVVNFHVILTLEKYYGQGSWIGQFYAYKDFGAVGVDIFFVISGFIMIVTNWSSFNCQKSLLFLFNRFLRIAPLYYFLTFVAFGIAIFLPDTTSIKADVSQLMYSMAFLPIQTFPVLKVGWTLNFEMYFYFIFSGLLFFSRRWFLLFGLCILILSIFARLFINLEISYLNALTNPLLIEFALGCYIGYLFKSGTNSSYSRWMLGGGVIGLITTAFTGIDENYRSLFWGLPSAMIIAGLVWNTDKQQSPLLRYFGQLLGKLGESSYSLYLSHALAMPVIGKLWGLFGLRAIFNADTYILASTLLLVLVGYLVFRLIEVPISNIFKHIGHDS